MPFQVSYSKKQQQLITVRLLPAKEQVLYCGLVVQLQAEVDDITALPGHPIQWEQIEGTAVILNDANTLQPWYSLTDKTDKVFRIWLDRGTPYAQYEDFYVFHTPTGFLRSAAQGAVTFSQIVPCDTVPCDSIVATVVVSPPPVGTNYHDDNVAAIITIPVVWNLPQNADLQPLLSNMALYENDVVVQNYSLASTRLYNGGLNKYKILAEFNVRGRYSACMSCEKDFTGLIIPATRIINDTFDYAGTMGGVTYSEVRFGNLNQRFEDTLTEGAMGGVTYSEVRFGNLNQRFEDTLTEGAMGGVTYNVTRFDPSGIGG